MSNSFKDRVNRIEGPTTNIKKAASYNKGQ